MDLPDIPIIDKFKPVPEEFHSFETGEPFERCCICDTFLLDDNTGYLIEKAFNKNETIFEYAMCYPCRDNLCSELSPASLKLIEHYFDERVDMLARRNKLITLPGLDHRPWINHCVLSGKAIQASSEYQIYGQCDGGDLLFTYLPYAICGEEIDSLSKSLSKKTRDRLDEFIDDVLGIPGAHIDIGLLI